MSTPNPTNRDLTLEDVPLGTVVRIAHRDSGVTKDMIGQVGTVTRRKRVYVIVTVMDQKGVVFDYYVRPFALELFDLKG